MILLALSGIAAGAQETPPPDKSGYTLFNPTPDKFMRELSADRPDKTDCPFTVDAGHFQVEMDFANFTYDAPNSQHGSVKSEAYQIAPMNLKAGLLNNMDLQLVLSPWQWQRTEDKTTGVVQHRSGFGDITPRVKVNLVGNDGGFFALGLIPYVKLPASQDHLGNSAVEGGLGIPYAFDIPGWDVGFQTGGQLQPERGWQRLPHGIRQFRKHRPRPDWQAFRGSGILQQRQHRARRGLDRHGGHLADLPIQ